MGGRSVEEVGALPNDDEALIRAACQAYAAGDVTGLLALLDPDLEWTYLDPASANPEPQICRGQEARDALAQGLRRRLAAGLRSDFEEIAGTGDRVLVVEHVPGLDATRLRQACDRNHLVFTVRDGRIVALRACRDRAEAAAVAGIDRTP